MANFLFEHEFCHKFAIEMRQFWVCQNQKESTNFKYWPHCGSINWPLVLIHEWASTNTWSKHQKVGLFREVKWRSYLCILNFVNISKLGGSLGLVVTGGGSCTGDCGFKSQHPILDGHFNIYFLFYIVKFGWKDENKRKRCREGPIKNISKSSLFSS